jgi:hypothetical protein
MIKRTSVKFTNPHASLALAARNQDGRSTGAGRQPAGLPQNRDHPDGRVIQVSDGNPNE